MRANQITEARVYGNGVFVKSLTQEETLEKGEDSEWEETEEALQSDEELEDDNKSCGIGRSNKREMFQRVTSKPNLRSLLTTLIHENGRATALQNAALRSAPVIHPHRTPNGAVGSSPRKNVLQGFPQPSIMTASNTHSPVPSLRSTRINMFSKELTGSLRKGLLWERETQSSTFNAVRRKHTTIKNLQNYPIENRNSCSFHFDAGLQDYHQRGW